MTPPSRLERSATLLVLIGAIFIPGSAAVRCNDKVSRALTALYQATNGANWNYEQTGYTNWMEGDACNSNNWGGLVVSSADVVAINLESANMNGTLPIELGQLSALTHFSIEVNPDLVGKEERPCMLFHGHCIHVDIHIPSFFLLQTRSFNSLRAGPPLKSRRFFAFQQCSFELHPFRACNAQLLIGVLPSVKLTHWMLTFRTWSSTIIHAENFVSTVSVFILCMCAVPQKLFEFFSCTRTPLIP